MSRSREPWKDFVGTVKARVRFYRAVWSDPETPRKARWLLGLGLGYLALPFDLIPDFLPIVGHLDDLVIVPGLLWLGMRSVPPSVYDRHRGLLEEPSSPDSA